MPGNSAVSGSWAIHSPATALMAWAPAVPFVPIPDSTTMIDFSFCSRASERKKSSTGRRKPRFSTDSPRLSVPSTSVRVCPGRIT